MNPASKWLSAACGMFLIATLCIGDERDKAIPAGRPAFDPTLEVLKHLRGRKVQPRDWPEFGGSPSRNNTPEGSGIPASWDAENGINIKWSRHLGSQTYGTPVIANGKLFIGTNNGYGYLKRYPSKVDLGVLLCFDAATGAFLWQHSNEKLPTGRVHDWPLTGVYANPCVDGDRLWYVSNRCEVVCLDTEGFRDGENDGPFTTEKPNDIGDRWDEPHEADVVWKLDMMQRFGVHPHNMSTCSVTAAGELLFVNTSNGVSESHTDVVAPQAPSFVCLHKATGAVVWTDNSPGANILHGQWSSPAYGIFNGRGQVLFGGGDGWLYSFEPRGEQGRSKLLWKFDCNPKTSVYALQRATRNVLVGMPVIYNGLVYIAVGEDPEHGDGDGHLWCINPINKDGDVSPTLVYNRRDPDKVVPPKRRRAANPDEGDFERPNPNSAAVWHYAGVNPESAEFTDVMHRTIGSVAIKNDLLFVADFSGCFHCVDATTGKAHWVHDMLAAAWGSPLIVDDKVYIGDEDGDIHIFGLSKHLQIDGLRLDENGNEKPQAMPTSMYSTPVVANDVLYIADKLTLYAIKQGAFSGPPKSRSFVGN